MMRDNAIDTAKGIAIILMMVGHTEGLWYPIFRFEYAFVMPLFFILSGYFYSSKRTLKDTILIGINKLIKPYLFGVIVISIITLFSNGSIIDVLQSALWGNDGSWHAKYFRSQPGIGPLWFLLSLFWCRIYYKLLDDHIAKHSILLCIGISVFTWFVGFYILTLPLCILNGATGLIFYAVGREIKRYNLFYNKYFTLITIMTFVYTSLTGYLGMVNYTYSCYPLNVIGGIGGVCAVYHFSKWWNMLDKRLMHSIGEASLYVLLIHSIALRLNIFDSNIPYLFIIVCIIIPIIGGLCYLYTKKRH